MKNLLLLIGKITEPTKSPAQIGDIMLAIPRIICGALLAFGFGSDKFGMPWSAGEVPLRFLEVAEWFPKDVAEFGGLFAMFPVFFAWLGAASEVFGGLGLVVGLQTRLSGFFIACTMLVAIFFQKWGGPLWHMLPAMGFLWVGMSAMVLGSGRFGLDTLLSKYIAKIESSPSSTKDASTNSNLSRTVVTASLLFCSILAIGQKNGNGNLITKNIVTDEIEAINVDLYAAVTIDGKASGIQITAESNLIDYIAIEMDNGILSLGQKEWIEPSKQIKIVIGSKELIHLNHGTWGTTTVKNQVHGELAVIADIGEVILSGQVEDLYVESKQGKIDASRLTAKNLMMMFGQNARGKFYVTDSVQCNNRVGAKVTFKRKPPGTKDCENKVQATLQMDVKYIKVKIKNNSWSRKHFEVVGYKPDGGRFSYGFAMLPFASKSEYWPTGTKVYTSNSNKENSLIELKMSDEGKTIKLFKK